LLRNDWDLLVSVQDTLINLLTSISNTIVNLIVKISERLCIVGHMLLRVHSPSFLILGENRNHSLSHQFWNSRFVDRYA
jgi:hypothetical protein